MAVQTSVTYAHGKAYEGMITSAFHVTDSVSRVIETATVAAGRFVKFGSTDGTATLATAAAAGDILGAVPYQSIGTQNDNGTTDNLNRSTDIITEGKMWAVCQDGCSPGDDVFVIIATAGGGVIGQTRTDADTANAVAISGKYLTTAAAGELAEISFKTV